MNPHVRPENRGDRDAVGRVHREAFGREDEAVLVDALREGGHARVSLVAEVEAVIAGHVLFSDLPIRTASSTVAALALAPLAVLPSHQRRGVGSLLVRLGLEICRKDGHRIVVVLGEPRFYGRFGFSAALARPLRSPYSGPHLQAAELSPGALAGIAGDLLYPQPFARLGSA